MPTEKSLHHNGAEMRYTVADGTAPERAIILMHGWGCQASTLAMIERIALQQGYTVYNVDFPGHGGSPDPPAAWGVEEFTEMIERLVATEKIERPALLGHSFGGRVGIMYAARHPADVAKLILVDAAGVKPRRSLRYYWKVYTFKASKRLAYLFLGRERAERRVEAMRKKRSSADYGSSTPMMRAVLSKVVNQDLKHLMPRIAAPTLLVWGENDTATPLSDAKTMERLIPDAGLVSFPGCGHYSFLDNPIQFTAVLRSFLN